MKKRWATGIVLLVMGIQTNAALGGEIIVIDPLTGRAASAPFPRDGGQSSISIIGATGGRDNAPILVLPDERVGPPALTGNPDIDARRGARHSRDRAAGYQGDGQDTDASERNVIIILDNDQVRSQQKTERSDTAIQAAIESQRAQGRMRGNTPCGTVVVGGIGEGSPPSPTSQTQDIYVLNSNCR